MEAIRHAISYAQIREMAGLFNAHLGGPSFVGSHWVQHFI
jgi:hypothetical protein